MPGEPLHDNDELRGASKALVLTEWKKVRNPSELNRKMDEPKAQANRYADGHVSRL